MWLEHFPRPFTKKEARMFAAEEETWQEVYDSVITDNDEEMN